MDSLKQMEIILILVLVLIEICKNCTSYRKDIEPLYHSLYVLTGITSSCYLSIPSNAFIACYKYGPPPMTAMCMKHCILIVPELDLSFYYKLYRKPLTINQYQIYIKVCLVTI